MMKLFTHRQMGKPFNQPMANSMSMLNNLIILCGHYKGIDYRIREHLITKEISVGDYVLTGGELAAAIITDAVVRLIPGAIGDEQSASPTRSRIICWLLRSIPGQPIIMDGKSLKSSYPDINARLRSGASRKLKKELPGYAPIY